MLKQEVVEAVQDGNFNIWSVGTVEEGIEVLTGKTAGRNEDGSFVAGGIFALVNQRLAHMAEELAKYEGRK
jgi:predicted ATP-dependent protease